MNTIKIALRNRIRKLPPISRGIDANFIVRMRIDFSYRFLWNGMHTDILELEKYHR